MTDALTATKSTKSCLRQLGSQCMRTTTTTTRHHSHFHQASKFALVASQSFFKKFIDSFLFEFNLMFEFNLNFIGDFYQCKRMLQLALLYLLQKTKIYGLVITITIIICCCNI